jgi:cellulose synthase/poly-beta-1,6-N-acetylglucosamine synthase-like glycosyltransferase
MMNPSNPLVSFVLLAYKQEKYIREAVKGAFAQTYSPLEIILSDDASPDGTFEIIQEMAATYQGPHKLILNRNETNLGVGRHVEKAFHMASGEWLVGAAGDDISLPHRCQRLMDEILSSDSSPLGIASAWTSIDEQGSEIPGTTQTQDWYERIRTSPKHLGIEGCRSVLCDGMTQLSGCSAMWSRRLIHEWPPLMNDTTCEDQILSCRALLTGTLIHLPDALVLYRTHPDSLTNFVSNNSRKSKTLAEWLKGESHAKAILRSFQQFMGDFNHFELTHKISCDEALEISCIRKKMESLEEEIEWRDLSTTERFGRWLKNHSKETSFSRRLMALRHVLPQYLIIRIKHTLGR